ncbi:MAG: tRNA (adenosine(37)-N6)-threonylcarbamoyltransferase complex dimerization subunit type 1 TsaB, partial [Planctomycetota bacterium]
MVQKPLILAVETSGRLGSVAIAIGEKILGEAAFSGPMRHSAELFPAINGLLEPFSRKPNEIDHIYISSGPGSFTGLRIAATFAKTMNLANAVKIVGVDTLDVIAANVSDYPNEQNTETELKKIAAILDAKRNQFFIAVYKRNTSHETQNTKHRSWEKICPDSLMTASQFLDRFAG